MPTQKYHCDNFVNTAKGLAYQCHNEAPLIERIHLTGHSLAMINVAVHRTIATMVNRFYCNNVKCHFSADEGLLAYRSNSKVHDQI